MNVLLDTQRRPSWGRPAGDNPRGEQPLQLTSLRNPSYSLLDPRAGPPSVWASRLPGQRQRERDKAEPHPRQRSRNLPQGPLEQLLSPANRAEQSLPLRGRVHLETSSVPQANGVSGTRWGLPLEGQSRPQPPPLNPTLHAPVFNVPLPGDLSY